MITLSQIREVWKNANVRAGSYVIRYRESSLKPIAYTMRWPGLGNPPAYFTDLSKHPRIFEPTYGGKVSSAAGAYQITATTYDDFAPRIGVTDFSEATQDALFVAIVESENALADLMRGDVEQFVIKVRNRWTSLPGASENTGYSMEDVRRVFKQFGGTLSTELTQPAAPIEDRSTIYVPDQKEEEPMAPILAGALPSLLLGLGQQIIQMFTPLAQTKIADAVNKATKSGDPSVGVNVAKAVLETAQKALGIPDQATPEATAVAVVAAAQAAQKEAEAQATLAKAEAVAAKAEAVQAAEDAALTYLDRIAPLVDKLHQMSRDEWTAEDASRDAAANRARLDDAEGDVAKTLLRMTGFTMIGILVVCGIVMGIQTWFNSEHEPSTSMLTLVGPLFGAVFAAYASIVAYRFGSSRASAGKDVVIGELSRRQR